MSRLTISFKALRELGPRQLGLYAWYQFGLRSGMLRRRTKDEGRKSTVRPSSFVLRPLLDLPGKEELAAVLGERAALLLAEADEIVGGRVRLFGGEPVKLRLDVPGPLGHWTEYEGAERKNFARERGGRGAGERQFADGKDGWPGAEDIKFIWEPGRFGWAYTLGRAYHLSGDEHYAEAFWKYTEGFLDANPANLGPHWASGQEVALRLIAFVFAAQVFSGSRHSTEQRRMRLADAVAEHARRIPPTLVYARAQNNNHLLTEAAGLYTAGAALPEHPQAARWRDLGWRWLNSALLSQIDGNGAYIQHSTNYHRLMLQAALWARRAAQIQGQSFPEATCRKLAAATRWLSALHDPDSGRVPNLGPNDGAYIQPLTICPYSDYRPVLQAASLAFLGGRAFSSGPWDEISHWLGVEGLKVNGLQVDQREFHGRPATFNLQTGSPQADRPISPLVLRQPKAASWAYFRAARFHDRPGHADQLHLDLWWKGLNVAQDAGTYLYNAAPPWENSLAGTDVHNTVALDGADQMTRAGRFLWLDWAQAQLTERAQAGGGEERAAAQHNGYRRLGAIHRREVTAHADGRWTVADLLHPVKDFIPDPSSSYNLGRSGQTLKASRPHSQPVNARLHWLLPDWPFEVEIREWRLEIQLQSPYGPVRLQVRYDPQSPLSNLHPPIQHQVVRAGELLCGEGPVSPTWGWASPTYGVKIPALSVSIYIECSLPISLLSEWIFPSS